MIFDYVINYPLRVPRSFLLVMVKRPVQSLALGTETPLLRCDRRDNRVLDREHERAVGGEAVVDLLAYNIEVLNIV